MKYLITSPDRYGRFGHQTLSIYGSILIAYISGAKLIVPSYMYFCEKWNTCVDWGKSKFTVNHLPATSNLVSYLKFMEFHDKNGNTRIQLKKASDIYTLIKRINLFDEESVIFLPFDQSIGKLNCLMNMPEIREDFANSFSLPLYFSPFHYRYACIHIRRGDCTPNAFPEWYVEDSFYEKLIKCLLELLPSDYKIHVCTQGDIEWIINLTSDKDIGRIIINTTSQLFTNDREIEDFFIMQRSNILFAAGSSFSHMASWCGNQELLFDVNKGRTNALYSSITLGVDEGDWSSTLQTLRRELAKISYA